MGFVGSRRFSGQMVRLKPLLQAIPLCGPSANKGELNEYLSNLATKSTGSAFILGPPLITIGAAIYLLGIERSPDGTTSWVEGIFLGFGVLIMVPAYFELARILGQRAPIFGIICAVTGLGWAIGLLPASDRIMQVEIINAWLALFGRWQSGI